MITLHPISAGSGIDYLLRTVVAGDVTLGRREAAAYWASGGDTPGQWLGRQAAGLGLRGQVAQADADALFKDGTDPVSGRPLGRVWPRYPTAEEHWAALLAAEPEASAARRAQLRERAEKVGNRTARSGWEMVCSPVKSFAVLWGTADDATRARLEEVERAAFREVFGRLEREACWTRTGPGGVVQQRGQGLIAAGFEHRSSRAGDPDWHRHVAISAKVRTADGRWLALDARHLHRLVVSLSAQYTAEIERGMHAAFGLLAAPRADSIRPDKRPVREFLGVPDTVIRAFSARRAQTERHLTALLDEFREVRGREPSRAEEYELAQRATLTARPHKRALGRDEERTAWRARARRLGIRRPERWLARAWRASRTPLRATGRGAPMREVVAAVLATLERDRESWTRANVEAETYRQLVAAGWHLRPGWEGRVERVVAAVVHPERCELISPPEPVPVPGAYLREDGSPVFVQHGAARYTSHSLRAREADLVEAARRPAPVVRLSAEEVDAVLDAGTDARGFAPSEEQRAVVRGVFTGDTRVRAITGPAGTGKTTVMALVREVADAHGLPVLGLAQGQVQADNLAARAGIRAENLARWHAMSRTHAPGDPAWTVPRNAIVIVDEAGQADTGSLHALLGQVARAGGRLLPIGDPRQLGAPGPGGALDLIATDAGALRLTEVRRFRDADGTPRRWEIDAAAAVSRGEADAAWRAYADRGRLREGSLDAMLNAARAAWRADTAEGLSSVLIAPTNALAAQLSRTARTERVAEGSVDDATTVELSDGNRAGAGDPVVTRANDRRLTCRNRPRQYVRNGDIWTVLAVTAGGDLRVRHTRTGGLLTLPSAYRARHAELGYALTHHRAQGVTVHTGHALIVPGMDRNGAYPALTRGSLENRAYLVTRDHPDPDTGEPTADLTARQVWTGVLTRDGTRPSATARRRAAFDEADSLRTHEPRLRQVLRDIAETEAVGALARLLGPAAAHQLATAPAWPALHAQLHQLADAGIDTDRLLTRTYRARDLHAPLGGQVNDAAAVLHARNRRVLDPDQGGDPAAHRLPDTAPRPATAATYETEPAADATDLLTALGLRMPTADATADAGDERRAYAHALARQLTERATALAEQAHHDARTGRGWAAHPRGGAWTGERLAAAAAYRDLADYRGPDPTGPAPAPEHAHLRGLWRAAQHTEHTPDSLPERAAPGPRPAVGSPAFPLWEAAARAVGTYRALWDHGAEDDPIGPRPAEPVQAADHDRAARALARWKRAVPPGARLTPRAPEEAARAAADRWHAARRAADRAAHLAQDAANRAAVAAATTLPGTAGTRAADLARRAAEARERATEAAAEAARAHAEHRAHERRAVDAHLRDAYAPSARPPRAPSPDRPRPPGI
ncbi:MobF family relaxase [Streptomyces marincola]|uniref:TrwC relaxase domain-containing protein n=1 Tax=Streptomyces marincola TaxID=2878388 RepID=A0A1W7CWI4_9ACTN|nr:MobF family relaxase [Streptomyces marincola]ARQ69183.1 hypothetical protein CAG99_10190 [Streptomyces marincola]